MNEQLAAFYAKQIDAESFGMFKENDYNCCRIYPMTDKSYIFDSTASLMVGRGNSLVYSNLIIVIGALPVWAVRFSHIIL